MTINDPNAIIFDYDATTVVRSRDLDNLAFALTRYDDDCHDDTNIACLAGYARLLIDSAGPA